MRFFIPLFLMILFLSAGHSAFADGQPQFIVALGAPQASSGTGAESWGLWTQDPGPRGCRLDDYPQLKATGVAPASWKFDNGDWWLEEHGLLMEKPQFPLPPGKYAVTGGREVTTLLTVYPKDAKGQERWELAGGVKLYDVTHLPCHAARYTPAKGDGSCSPEKAKAAAFPVAPGIAMPEVDGCRKKEYAVLFVVGIGK